MGKGQSYPFRVQQWQLRRLKKCSIVVTLKEWGFLMEFILKIVKFLALTARYSFKFNEFVCPKWILNSAPSI